MYRVNCREQLEFPNFYLPFAGELDSGNRWIALAQLVPWDLADEIYRESLCGDFGAPALPARVALGALLIKERLGLTDRETVEAIRENPYLQFFIGKEEFQQTPPFDASLMVGFRKRFGEEGLSRIGKAVAMAAIQEAGADTEPTDTEPTDTEPTDTEPTDTEPTDDDAPHDDDVAPHGNAAVPPTAENGQQTSPSAEAANHSQNRGQLIVDATCAPADIRYPTDVSLLNEARQKTEELIDELHAPLLGTQPRPRTYRVKARRAFVTFVRRKKPKRNAVRRATRQQLGFLQRNLQFIDRLLETPGALPLSQLSRRDYKNLLVCREVCRQQLQMYETKTHRIDDRIVSLSQPHVRPIKRGKAGRDTEFGAKLSISVAGGFSFLDRLSWDNYNESLDLVGQIEAFREQFGFYPKSVHADKIYRNRANRKHCKERGIRLSGPPLGRPPKHVSAAEKKQAMADEAVRNAVEGKFGQAKRRFGLGRVMAKLAATSAAQISLSFLVMNLELALRRLFLWLCFAWRRFVGLQQSSLARPDRSTAPFRRPRPPHSPGTILPVHT